MKKKHNDHKRHKERKRSSSYSSSDSEDARPSKKLGADQQLAMSRRAATALREVLAHKYELVNELRHLARELDTGNALNISGIADEFLLSRLRTVFDNLPLILRKLSTGHYARLQGASTLISFMAPILDEDPTGLAQFRVETTAQPSADLALAGCVAGPSAVPNGSNHPTKPQQLGSIAMAGQDESDDKEVALEKRILGPALPPPEFLQAAATMKWYASDEDRYEDLDMLVGPPPPELELQMESASSDERAREVTRVLRVLREYEATHTSDTAPGVLESGPDAYDILGVDPAASAGNIRKRYWRLSLLIHPDKCDHPNAGEAFQAVATAAQELQDSETRQKVDKRREDAELKKFTAEFAAQEARERQWRVAREEAVPLSVSDAPTVANAARREEWMTELPPERGPASLLPVQNSQRAFSSRGPQSRGDTSQWTMTPQELAAARLISGAHGTSNSGAPAKISVGEQRMRMPTTAVDSGSTRRRSLLEKHLEKQQKLTKKQKKAENSDGGMRQADADWDRTAHPWRPFDRDRDLEVKPAGGPMNPQDLLKGTQGLSSRFARGR